MSTEADEPGAIAVPDSRLDSPRVQAAVRGIEDQTAVNGLFGNEGGVGDLAGGWESTKSEEGPSIIGCWKTTSEAGGPLWRLILRA